MALDIIKFAKQERISKTNVFFCQNAYCMATLIVKALAQGRSEKRYLCFFTKSGILVSEKANRARFAVEFGDVMAIGGKCIFEAIETLDESHSLFTVRGNCCDLCIVSGWSIFCAKKASPSLGRRKGLSARI